MTEPHYDRRRAVFNEIQVRQINDLITERIGALTSDEINEIAEAAADKAVEKMTAEAYRLVGKTFVDKFLWFVGVLVIGAVSWATGKGWLKL